MRHIARPELIVPLVLVVAAGCTNTESLSPDSARTSNTTARQSSPPEPAPAADHTTTRQFDITSPPADTADPVPGGDWENPPAPAVNDALVDTDSDTPRSDVRREADAAGTRVSATDGAAADAAVADTAAEPEGRHADGDDPQARLIVPQAAKNSDHSPLNNGRTPDAQPIPADQRVAIQATAVDPATLDSGRGSDPAAGASAAKTEAPVLPARRPATPARTRLSNLAASLQELDKDGDGQLGLYEWPREKLAEFKTLDTNQDGFLTPAELVAGQKKANDSATSQADGGDDASKQSPTAEAGDDASKGASTEEAGNDTSKKTPAKKSEDSGDDEETAAAEATDPGPTEGD